MSGVAGVMIDAGLRGRAQFRDPLTPYWKLTLEKDPWSYSFPRHGLVFDRVRQQDADCIRYQYLSGQIVTPGIFWARRTAFDDLISFTDIFRDGYRSGLGSKRASH